MVVKYWKCYIGIFTMKIKILNTFLLDNDFISLDFDFSKVPPQQKKERREKKSREKIKSNHWELQRWVVNLLELENHFIFRWNLHKEIWHLNSSFTLNKLQLGLREKEREKREIEWNESPDNNKVNSYCYSHGITWWCCFCCHDLYLLYSFSYFLSLALSCLPLLLHNCHLVSVPIPFPLETSVYIALSFLLTFGKYSHTCYLKHTHTQQHQQRIILTLCVSSKSFAKNISMSCLLAIQIHTHIYPSLSTSNSRTQKPRRTI